ncbi:MAG TPA: DUF6629 family protein [Gemmataceae bacterium]|jgi:hypothetical protein|nr:DUF6629 family protein [Gemmataceae bacterium]
MCFSVEASLTVGAALVPAGIYCIRAGWKKDRRYIPLAVIPLLFAIQQFFEAGVWAGLDHGYPTLTRWASLGFLFFALGFWPFWLPFAAVPLAPPGPSRELFYMLVAVGLTFGSVGYCPVAMNTDLWPEATLVQHSIRYDFSNLPLTVRAGEGTWAFLYLAIVALPLLLLPDRRIKILGLLLIASAALAFLLFRYAFASVWCFFAAVLSLYLCLVLNRVPAGPTR